MNEKFSVNDIVQITNNSICECYKNCFMVITHIANGTAKGYVTLPHDIKCEIYVALCNLVKVGSID